MQEKAIDHPVSSRLLEIARHEAVAAARDGVHRQGRGLQTQRLRKVSVAVTSKQGVMVGTRSLTGNPRDGYTLAEQLEQVKILPDQQRRWLKRRQAVDPAIGYLKQDNAMDRCWLHGATGDALHAVLCAAG